MADRTVKDFQVGDRVQHLFTCTYGTVVSVGRKYLHVEIATPGRAYRYGEGRETPKSELTSVVTWFPTSARKVYGI